MPSDCVRIPLFLLPKSPACPPPVGAHESRGRTIRIPDPWILGFLAITIDQSGEVMVVVVAGTISPPLSLRLCRSIVMAKFGKDRRVKRKTEKASRETKASGKRRSRGEARNKGGLGTQPALD